MPKSSTHLTFIEHETSSSAGHFPTPFKGVFLAEANAIIEMILNAMEALVLPHPSRSYNALIIHNLNISNLWSLHEGKKCRPLKNTEEIEAELTKFLEDFSRATMSDSVGVFCWNRGFVAAWYKCKILTFVVFKFDYIFRFNYNK